MSDVMPTVTLEVNGQQMEGFKSGSISLSLEAVASAFRFTYSDIWLGSGKPFAIGAGDFCEVRIDDELVVDGYVDAMAPSYTDREHSITIEGRSRAGDLVDCSVSTKIIRFRERTVAEICRELLEPFGLEVVDEVGESEPLQRFTVDPGEMVLSTIRKAASLRGLIIIERAGKLVLTRIGSKATATALGVQTAASGASVNQHVLAASRREDWAQRFSEYRFRGQTQGRAEVHGDAAAHNEGIVIDESLVAANRYRPMMLTDAGGNGRKDLELNAAFERNRRAGQSERVTYRVSGWQTVEGKLWRPNTIVRIHDDWLRIQAKLLTTKVTYQIAAPRRGQQDGFATDLELGRPEGFGTAKYPVRLPNYVWKERKA